MYLYYAFIISVVLLGSITVGPLSIRVYMTVVMMIHLLWLSSSKKYNKYIATDYIFIKLYILFQVFMGVALLLNGEIFEYQFFKILLAYHLVSIITFGAIENYVKSYQDVNRTILLLSVIMLINNTATILQYLGNDIGWAIGMLLGDIQNNMDFLDFHESLLGYSRTPGIFGSVVNNAFAIAVFSPLPLCLVNRDNRTVYKIFAIASLIVASVACFMTQQRAAFYLFLLCFAIYLFVAIRKHAIIIVVLGVLAMLFVDGLNFDNMDIGRLSKTTDDARSGLYKHAFEFISEHPILGGPMSFQRMAGLSSHNVALDSWIFAGFFGFVTMMILICKTLQSGIKTFIRGINVKGQDRYMIFCSVAVINAMVYGFTHNTSYLTGNALIFIVLALMLKSSNINYK